MKLKSIWRSTAKEYPRLEKYIDRDIVVIGGGIAGYLTAFRLTEAGQSVTLLEADRLFSGTTGRTTAKISANQGSVYADLVRRYGESVALLYYQAQLDGMKGFEELVRRYDIDCDFKKTDGYIFSEEEPGKIDELFRTLRSFGADCGIVRNEPPFEKAAALKMTEQYLFDPLKFLSSLPAEFEIYENTRAIKVDVVNKLVYTGGGCVKAKKIIVATHYPIINPHGSYIMKLRQSTSYTIAVKEKCSQGMWLEERTEGLSVRPFREGTLFGGIDHRTGRIGKYGKFEKLMQRVKAQFGAVNITNGWAAQDVMTFDGMPMAGRYAKNLKDIYVVTGFNKWGMTNSMVCASILTDAILERGNPYSELFSPSRRIKKNLVPFISNAFTNLSEIFLGYFRFTIKGASEILPGQGMIVFYRGKRRAVYRDEDGKLYVIGRMCPHMHGELKWNGDTKSWDCPCHGSRFDIYGNILSEPSVKACKCKQQNPRL